MGSSEQVEPSILINRTKTRIYGNSGGWVRNGMLDTSRISVLWLFLFFFFGEMEETYEWDKSAGGVVFWRKRRWYKTLLEESGRDSGLGNSKRIAEHINSPPEVSGHDSKWDQSTRLGIFLQAQSWWKIPRLGIL